MRKATCRSRTEGRGPDSMRVAEKALLGVTAVLLLAIVVWSAWTSATGIWSAFFDSPALDAGTREEMATLAEGEPAPLWQQVLMPFAMFGLLAAPVAVVWLVARGGQALHGDLLALRAGASTEGEG